MEIVDVEQRVFRSGIVRWDGKSHELISFEEGRVVGHVDSFRQVSIADLAAEFVLDPKEVAAAVGEPTDHVVWVRYLKEDNQRL